MDSGWFYYFLRLPGPFRAGHIGWGCQLPGRFMCGGLENASGGGAFVSPNTPATAFFNLPRDNDYWSSFFTSEALMLEEMRTVTVARRMTQQPGLNPYTAYKKVPVLNPDPGAAVQKGMFWQGYALLGSNCLDNTTTIASAYGVDHSLRKRWHNVRPRGFFYDILRNFETIELHAGSTASTVGG